MMSACFASAVMSASLKREAVPVGGRNIDGAHARLGARIGVNHLDRLAAEILSQDGAPARAQRRLVDIKLIRVDGALHHGLAQAIGGRDENHIAKTRIRIEREHDAGRAQIAAHHVLHADGERHRAVIEFIVHPIGYRAVVEQRGVHFMHGLEQMLLAAHIEECFLLAGKGGFGKIFRRRRGAHRDRELGGDRSLPFILRQASSASVCRRSGNGVASIQPRISAPTTAKLLHIIHIERRERRANALIEAALRQEIPIGVRGRGKTARHRNAQGRQAGDHFSDAKRSCRRRARRLYF